MNRLKEARKAKGMTQIQVSSLIGLSQNGYSDWETGRNRIDDASLQRLSEIFDVSIDYLLGLSDIKKPPVSEDDERLKEVLANVDAKTREAIELLDQLTPDNLERAKEYIRFELARQGDAGDKR